MSNSDTRGYVLAATVTILAFGVLLWTPLGNPSPGGFSDSIDYLNFADYFRNWFAGTVSPIDEEFVAHTRFPPLYPLLIGLLHGGTTAPMQAYWLTTLAAMAVIVMSFYWFRREIGSVLAASLLLIPLALNPGVFLLTINPMSEPLFTMFLVGSFLLADRTEKSRTSMFAFALCVAAAPLCRTAGLALVLAAAVWLFVRHQRTVIERLIAIAIMLTPQLLWMAYRSILPIVERYDQQLTLDRILTAFGGWSGWLIDHPIRIIDSFGDMFHPSEGPIRLAAGALLLGFAAWGWWLRARRWQLDALFLPPYLGLIFVWPYPAEVGRLALPALPVALMAAFEGVRALVALLRRREASVVSVPVAAGMAMVALILIAPFTARSLARAVVPVDAELARFKRQTSYFLLESEVSAQGSLELNARIVAAMEEVPNYVSREDCVNSFQPQALWYHARGMVRSRMLTYPLDFTKPLGEQIGHCKYMLLVLSTSPQFKQPPLYPMNDIPDRLKPVFMSTLEVQGKKLPAVALVEVTDPSVHPESSTTAYEGEAKPAPTASTTATEETTTPQDSSVESTTPPKPEAH